MVLGVNGYSSRADIANKSVSSNNVDNSKKFTTDAAYKLQADSILSSIHIQTGESIGIFYDETSTDSNPVMLAKVIEPDGSVNEVKVDINSVDSNSASYVEMLALSAYLKSEGKIDGAAGEFATMVYESRIKEANNDNIYSKENFVPAMQDLVNTALKNRQMDTYLIYMKELDIYLNWFNR